MWHVRSWTERWKFNLFSFPTEEKAQTYLRGLDQNRLGEMISVRSSKSQTIPRRSSGLQRRLCIQLVPTPLHGINLRNALGASKWSQLRRGLLAKHDGQCEYCETAVANQRDLHVHEEWLYEIGPDRNTATLQKLRIICWRCHACVHFGRTLKVEGQKAGGPAQVQSFIDHYCSVNDVDCDSFVEHLKAAENDWERLSKCQWTVDLGSFG